MENKSPWFDLTGALLYHLELGDQSSDHQDNSRLPDRVQFGHQSYTFVHVHL